MGVVKISEPEHRRKISRDAGAAGEAGRRDQRLRVRRAACANTNGLSAGKQARFPSGKIASQAEIACERKRASTTRRAHNEGADTSKQQRRANEIQLLHVEVQCVRQNSSLVQGPGPAVLLYVLVGQKSH